MKKSDEARFLKKNPWVEILGKRGSKNGVFGIFSKTALTIWFFLLVKEDIIILHICAKLQVQANFCSRDMGSNGGSKGVENSFLGFSQKLASRYGSFC